MIRSRESQRGAADRKYRQSPFAPAAEEPLLARVIPLTKRLSGYRADAGRRDLVAGLTVAALALPSGMAYAELAGLSPVNGLYALLLPSVAYALLASSRQVIVGPEGVACRVDCRRNPSAGSGREPGRGRARGAARALHRRPVLARASRAAGLDRRLPVAARAGRIHPRCRRCARHRPARQAARPGRGGGRPDSAAGRGGTRDR